MSLAVHIPLLLVMERWGHPGEQSVPPEQLMQLSLAPEPSRISADLQPEEQIPDAGELQDLTEVSGERSQLTQAPAQETQAPEQAASEHTLDTPSPKEEEPELAHEPELDEHLVHVSTEEQSSEAPLPETNHISQVDLSAAEQKRAPTSAPELGEAAPGEMGAPGQRGNRSPDTTVAPDQQAARRGEKEAELQAPVEETTPLKREAALGEAGLGQAGGAQANGPSEMGDRAAGRAGQDSTGAGAHTPSQSSVGGAQPALAGSQASPSQAPEGWLPMAVRVDPSVGRAPPTLAPSDQYVVEREPELEILKARGQPQPETVGAQGEQDHSADKPSEIALDDAPAVTELENDGADTPQTSPGWGGDQVLKSQTQASIAGELTLDGAPASSKPEVLEQEVEVGEQTTVQARAHEHAEYMDEVRRTIDRLWKEQTPTEFKAMGYQGTVTLRVELDSRGRVVSKQVVRQSGYPELDALALASVPKRLPKPPKGLAEPTWTYNLNLRMNDQWASAGP